MNFLDVKLPLRDPDTSTGNLMRKKFFLPHLVISLAENNAKIVVGRKRLVFERNVNVLID